MAFPNHFKHLMPDRNETNKIMIQSSFVRIFFITGIWYLFFVLYSAIFLEKPGFTSIIIWLIGIYVVLELVVLFLKLNLNSNNDNSEIMNLPDSPKQKTLVEKLRVLKESELYGYIRPSKVSEIQEELLIDYILPESERRQIKGNSDDESNS